MSRTLNSVTANAKRPLVLFRADATVRTGMGHISQDIHLARALGSSLGTSAVFAGQMDDGAVGFLESHGVEDVVPLDPVAEDDALASLLARTRPLVSIVDVLERDTDPGYMALFRQHSSVVVALTASSQPRPIPADLVFAFNVNQRQSFYSDTASTAYYTGPDYFIVPPNVREARMMRPKTVREVARVLVLFGGNDPNDTSLLVARTLSNPVFSVDVTFVVSPLYRRADTLRAYVERASLKGRVEQNVGSLASYLRAADLLICSCGNIAYEGCAVGMPMVTINQVVRQEEQAVTLDDMGCLVNAGMEGGLTIDRLTSVVMKIIGDRRLRADMRQRGMATVDGEGLSRVTSLIVSELAGRSSADGSAVTEGARRRHG